MAQLSTPWSKAVKCAMIMQDISTGELAKRIGRSREHTSAVINIRVRSEQTAGLISDALNIENNYTFELTQL